MPPLRKLPCHLETDPKKMLERLVGLPEVNVIGLHSTETHVELHIESVATRPGCLVCGTTTSTGTRASACTPPRTSTMGGHRPSGLSGLSCSTLPTPPTRTGSSAKLPNRLSFRRWRGSTI